MITVLQRQHVSRRAAPSVHLRARSVGVHWRNEEQSAPPPVSVSRQFLAPRQPKDTRRKIIFRPQPAEAVNHSFLQGQLIRRERRRETRRIERSIQRIAGRQDTRRRETRRIERSIQRIAGRRDTRRQDTRRQDTRRQAPAQAAAPAVGSPSALLRTLRSPWLLLGLAAAAVAVILAPTLRLPVIVLSPQHPALPLSEEADQSIYSLLVPEETAPQETTVNPIVLSSLKVSQYRTQSGDSLSKIAARFHLSIDTLVSWNEIRDARSLPAGAQLEIPNRDGLKYRVRRGDTLQGIAGSYGIDFNGLLDANLLASSVISVGQELFLPGAHMSPTELGKVMGSLFMWPVQGRISSYFGDRPDPFTGQGEYHNGIDIVNKPGTPILAAMAGTVAQVGMNYSYGYYVIIKHAGNYQTLYGHLTRYVIANKEKVQQGQKIGELGTTGYSTGPHLHFSIFKNGQPVDPMRFLK